MQLPPIVPPPEARFQVDRSYTFGRDPSYLFSQQAIATTVGLVAVGLPVALMIGAYGEGELRFSVSHYYYSPIFGDLFVGALSFIGAMLIAFRGGNKRENLVTTLAGLATLLVPLFPAGGAPAGPGTLAGRVLVQLTLPAPPGSDIAVVARGVAPNSSYFDLNSWAGTVHGLAAAVTFGVLAFLCLVVFTRIDDAANLAPDGGLKRTKVWRDRIYRTAGTVIVICLAAMLARVYLLHNPPWWNAARLTFICETLMIWCFGTAWIVKGRAFGWFLAD